jgi:hypothetical protein
MIQWQKTQEGIKTSQKKLFKEIDILFNKII